jgi:hypothetical protein
VLPWVKDCALGQSPFGSPARSLCNASNNIGAAIQTVGSLESLTAWGQTPARLPAIRATRRRLNTTVREANDCGYDCLVLEDCCGSYFPDFYAMGLKMIKAQGGIFGWVSSSEGVISRLEERIESR